MAPYIKLDPSTLTVLRTVNPRLISYNVEMTEVIGGTLEVAPGSCAFILV